MPPADGFLRGSIEQGTALRLRISEPATHLRLELGNLDAANGYVSGKIYLCTPDEMKSYVLGTFNAEIRKPKPSR